MNRFSVRTLLALMALAATPATFAETAGIAATVNGAPISERQVALLMKQGGPGQAGNPQLRKAVIDDLAMQLLVAQAAAKNGLDKSPEIIEQTELTRQAILANAFMQNYLQNHPIQDEALRAEYDKTHGKAGGLEYRARHILVEKEAAANDIIKRVKKNAKGFDALAKAKSKDPGSASKGGDLGWFDPSGMVPEFRDAVIALGKGGLSATAVKTQFGYHVIQVDDTRPMPVPTLEQVRPDLQQQLRQQSLKALLEEMKAKATIEITELAK